MEKYIKELLFENDCVVVPGFGGFLTQYVSADIHPITHKFIPPFKKVAFNEQLQTNDGVLINAICQCELISKDEAIHKIKEFTDNAKDILSKRNLFELKDIGRFFYNTENKLEFEPETKTNYLEESYGLSEIFFKPIERNFTTMNKPSQVGKPVRQKQANTSEEGQEGPKKSQAGLIIFAVLFLLLGGATTFLYFNQDNQDLASINPFVILQEQNKNTVVETPPVVVADTVAEEPIAEVTTEEQPIEREEVITSKTGRYFVVIGSFKRKDNAFKVKENFESQSQSVSIIEPYGKKKFYRVSIADFETIDEAKTKMEELKASYGKNIWILTY
jgi:cell division protein FtsN